MPLKLDTIDAAILKCLIEDGRHSFRQIANLVGVSTPTVESRFRKMVETGIIKKSTAILDADRVEGGVAAIILLNAELSKLNYVIERLFALEEVRSIFVVTGGANLMLRVVLPSSKSLQDFLETNIAPLQGVNLVSSQTITKTIKDEQGVALFNDMAVNVICVYCKGVVSGKPFTLNVGEGKRYFCRKTCLTSYKEKYKTRLAFYFKNRGED
jgi:DNA-binding Lrp family transcriptional regulator